MNEWEASGYIAFLSLSPVCFAHSLSTSLSLLLSSPLDLSLLSLTQPWCGRVVLFWGMMGKTLERDDESYTYTLGNADT